MRIGCTVAVVAYLLALLIHPPSVPAQDGELKRADELNQQVIQLYQQGKYGEAISVGKEALAIREKALGPDHLDVALSLNNLAGLYRALGDYAKAEPLYKRSLNIYENTLGPDHLDVAQSLNNLAAL